MEQDIFKQKPIEVENESDLCATVQLSQTTIQDSRGKREICPRICIYLKQEEQKKGIALLFNTEQVAILIRQLETLKTEALAYEKDLQI